MMHINRIVGPSWVSIFLISYCSFVIAIPIGDINKVLGDRKKLIEWVSELNANKTLNLEIIVDETSRYFGKLEQNRELITTTALENLTDKFIAHWFISPTNGRDTNVSVTRYFDWAEDKNFSAVSQYFIDRYNFEISKTLSFFSIPTSDKRMPLNRAHFPFAHRDEINIQDEIKIGVGLYNSKDSSNIFRFKVRFSGVNKTFESLNQKVFGTRHVVFVDDGFFENLREDWEPEAIVAHEVRHILDYEKYPVFFASAMQSKHITGQTGLHIIAPIEINEPNDAYSEAYRYITKPLEQRGFIESAQYLSFHRELPEDEVKKKMMILAKQGSRVLRKCNPPDYFERHINQLVERQLDKKDFPILSDIQGTYSSKLQYLGDSKTAPDHGPHR